MSDTTRTPAVRRTSVASWILPAAVVLVWGVGGAMTWLRLQTMLSGDFQWTGARMLGHGVSPYLVYFQHGGHAFMLNQNPNYLPLLYVLLAPLGLLSFHTASSIWAVTNIAMALASSTLLAAPSAWPGGRSPGSSASSW